MDINSLKYICKIQKKTYHTKKNQERYNPFTSKECSVRFTTLYQECSTRHQIVK